MTNFVSVCQEFNSVLATQNKCTNDAISYLHVLRDILYRDVQMNYDLEYPETPFSFMNIEIKYQSCTYSEEWGNILTKQICK